MNKKIIVTTAVFIALLAGSCNKFLTIQPQFEFTSTIATSSLDGLTKTAIGGFAQLQSANLYGGGIIANSELLADFVYPNLSNISDYNLLQLVNRQLNSTNSQCSGLWGDAYRAIYIANVVLQYAPNFNSQNPAQVKLIRGQAYFIRGIMHFELLRMFAQPSGFTADDSHLGIPIVLAPGTITQGQSTPRSTVAQCYAQIESDLDSAYILLPSNPQSIASQGAAAAFLVRAYFTQHNYQQALNWANIVINNYSYSLNPTVDTIYNITNVVYTPETIFQQISYLGSTGAQGTSASNVKDVSNATLTGNFYAYFLHPANYGCSSFFHTQFFAPDSAAGDLRAQQLYVNIGLNFTKTQRALFTTKYNDPNMNVTVVRLAEIILTRAECNARTGASDETVRKDLNLIRVRAGLEPDNSTSGQQALIAAIWGQRDFELAYEGDRFYEIKRRQISFVVPETGQVLSWNSPQLVYPIPLQEVQENKNMQQNPGY